MYANLSDLMKYKSGRWAACTIIWPLSFLLSCTISLTVKVKGLTYKIYNMYVVWVSLLSILIDNFRQFFKRSLIITKTKHLKFTVKISATNTHNFNITNCEYSIFLRDLSKANGISQSSSSITSTLHIYFYLSACRLLVPLHEIKYATRSGSKSKINK